MLETDGEKREFQTPGIFKLLDWDSSRVETKFGLNLGVQNKLKFSSKSGPNLPKFAYCVLPY
jgi:hypothetical protein